MRFVAPAREAVDAEVFARPPLSQWNDFGDLLRGDWPGVSRLNACRVDESFHFVAQTPELLADGEHYEQRIFKHGAIATRERTWHDLLNALVWLRFAEIKRALNARQVAEIAKAGPKQRTRAQCALTHFDEGGIVVVVRDAALLASWDAHDWHGLFWRERGAWSDGRIEAVVFGHALLEHALEPAQLLIGKCIVVMHQSGNVESATRAAAVAIARNEILNDPQELRPLPLSGIPGWHPDNGDENFYRTAPCFRPLRAGRAYPVPLLMAGLHRSI